MKDLREKIDIISLFEIRDFKNLGSTNIEIISIISKIDTEIK